MNEIETSIRRSLYEIMNQTIYPKVCKKGKLDLFVKNLTFSILDFVKDIEYEYEEEEEEEKQCEEEENQEENDIEEEVPFSFWNEEEMDDIMHSVLHLIDEFVHMHPKRITEKTFHDDLMEYLWDTVQETIVEPIHQNTKQYTIFDKELSSLDETLEEIIDTTVDYYYNTVMPRRSHSETFVTQNCMLEEEKRRIKEKIVALKNIPQPKQRTEEWYTFRNNLITASSAYKAFENQTIQNQLIFEKCQAIHTSTTNTNTTVNLKSPFHWGQKYEPLSVMIYEQMYQTTVGDFGCIQHPKYSFLGASPDGINVDPQSTRFGRMLEIKNIVNREIDGKPKKEYWVQMQLQMEVCDLDECDFLETRFVEYSEETNPLSPWLREETLKLLTEEEMFKEDGNENEFYTKTGKHKGLILYFARKDGSPHYEYMPLYVASWVEMETWAEDMIERLQIGQGFTWIKNIYWRLEECSCVLVERNRFWFQSTVHEIEALWRVVEKERESGDFSQRGPKKRINTSTKQYKEEEKETKCLISLSSKKKSQSEDMEPGVIRIRTKSIDETRVEENIL